MVLGANTFRQFAQVLGPGTEESDVSDPVNTRMRNMPTQSTGRAVHRRRDGWGAWSNSAMQGGPVDELLDVAVEGVALE